MPVLHENVHAGTNGVYVPGLKAMLISALINVLSEFHSLCTGFLVLVGMEHCYPRFCNIFRICYHLEVN